MAGTTQSLLRAALVAALALSGGAASAQPQSAAATAPQPAAADSEAGNRPDSLPPRPLAPGSATSAEPPSGSPAAAGTETPARELVLDRRRRQLLVLEGGRPMRRFPVAVGMPGWETPVGRFEVIEMTADPIWEHPISGLQIPPGPNNPLGSRWIGFHRDCNGRKGARNGVWTEMRGCVVAGFHGTPNRASVGRAVSHGCVRLYDEDARALFALVQLGTPVRVLP
ncbi:MAG: L,D-transpeptidase [Synechococcus sp. ELA057]